MVTIEDLVPPQLAAAILTGPLKAISEMSGPQGILLVPLTSMPVLAFSFCGSFL